MVWNIILGTGLEKSNDLWILGNLDWVFYDICLVTQITFLIRPDSKFQVCTQVIFPRRFPSKNLSWYQGKLKLGQEDLLSGRFSRLETNLES